MTKQFLVDARVAEGAATNLSGVAIKEIVTTRADGTARQTDGSAIA